MNKKRGTHRTLRELFSEKMVRVRQHPHRASGKEAMTTTTPDRKDVTDAQDRRDSYDDFDSCVPKGHATAPENDAERDVNILAGGAF
jgi:hypothetical protein